MNPKWNLLCVIERGGHALFRRDPPYEAQDGKLTAEFEYALADDSGLTPDATEDGPVYLDFTRPIDVRARGNVPYTERPAYRSTVLVPIFSEKGYSRGRTIVGFEGATTLIDKFPDWAVDLDLQSRLAAGFLLRVAARAI